MTIYMWTDCVPKFVTLPSPSLTQHVVKMHIFRAFFVLMSRNCDIFRHTLFCHCDTLLEKDKHKQEKIVRLSTVIITANTEIHSGVHLQKYMHRNSLKQRSQANFVWCRHMEMPVKPIYEELKRRMILVRYMAYEGYGDGLRVSVGTDGEIDRLLQELKGMV